MAQEPISSKCAALLSVPGGGFEWHVLLDRHYLGISVQRLAFWLTDGPAPSILRFDLVGGYRGQMIGFNPIPEYIVRSRSMQLGRTGQYLALLVVSEERLRVEMYIWDEDMMRWMLYMSLGVRQFDAASMENPWDAQTGIILCKEWLRPLRFESDYVQTLLWEDRQVALWDGNTINSEQSHMRFLIHGERMPGENVSVAVPYTFTRFVPSNSGTIGRLHGHN